MRLQELKPSHAKMLSRGKVKAEHFNDIETWLHKHNYEQIGVGGFGKVYADANSNIAIKFNKRPDECYRIFADYAYKNRKNPHLPKMSPIRNVGKSVAVQRRPDEPDEHDQWIVFMEKLEPLSIYKYENHMEETFLKYVVFEDDWMYGGPWFDEKNYPIWDEIHNFIISDWAETDDVDYINYLLDKHKLLIMTLLTILALDPICKPDLALRNFMVRPSTNDIVITDPLYS